MMTNSPLNTELKKGIDPLTKLYNRQFLYQTLVTMPHSRDTHLPTSFVLFDVLGLMHYNSLLSYSDGDLILQAIAKLLQNHLPEGAIAGRWDSNSFGVILPFSPLELSKPWAAMVAEAARCLKLPVELPCYIKSIHLLWSCVASPPCTLAALPQHAENQLKQKRWENEIDVDGIFVPKEELPYAHGIVLALLNQKSPYLREFTVASAFYCQKLGEALNFSAEELLDLRTAALWQDIGLIKVSLEILAKPTPITLKEREEIHKHIEYSAIWAENFGVKPKVVNIIKYHHTRWDGTGFKNRATAERIPIESRIIKLASKWTMLQQHLFWHWPINKENSLKEITGKAGQTYDRNLVEILAAMSPSLPNPEQVNTQFYHKRNKSPNFF